MHITLADYEKAISSFSQNSHVVLKRKPSECNINNYNPAMMKAWQANMDIQYVLNAYACIMYVAAYMMKNERAMGQLLQHISQEVCDEEVHVQLKK